MEWFRSWFDSPYYHILYDNRNDAEAKFFIDNLLKHFSFNSKTKILDAGCGRGRHSVYLNRKGFDVTGFDLSKSNIEHNKKSECRTLHFFVHDIRNVFRENHFDFVLNLFSSFGYFESDTENIRATQSLSKALNPAGLLIIDFLNIHLAKKELREEETIKVRNIVFRIQRKAEENFLLKNIDVDDSGNQQHFTERIMTLTLNDFEKYFAASGMRIKSVFGNYTLEPFIQESSPRLILVAEKTGLS